MRRAISPRLATSTVSKGKDSVSALWGMGLAVGRAARGMSGLSYENEAGRHGRWEWRVGASCREGGVQTEYNMAAGGSAALWFHRVLRFGGGRRTLAEWAHVGAPLHRPSRLVVGCPRGR